MTQERIVERTTVTETSAAPRETIEKEYVTGAPHGNEEAGGAVGGAVAGAVVGAVVGGPVGAVVGGAIGAAAGTTAGAVDEKAKDNTVRHARSPALITRFSPIGSRVTPVTTHCAEERSGS